MEVKPVDPKNRASVRIGFDDRATGAVTAFRRALDLGQLPPGAYQLVVTITANGQSASRVQGIRIVGAAPLGSRK